MTDFFTAIATGDVAGVRGRLDADPGLLAEAGPSGASAALTALYHGHPALADELAARTGTLSIFEAAAFDDTARLAELIEADPGAVRAWSADGWQPLHLAAANANLDAIKALVAQGADVTAGNGEGLTALTLAQEKNHREAASLLRRYGA